jgi:hypothetical protein
LVDLDADGLGDILSGSWPGEVYFFRRNKAGTFDSAETLKDRAGKPINVGHASSAFAADWDGDGKLDLLIGTLTGEVFFLANEKKMAAPVFAAPVGVIAGGKPIKVNGDAAPVVADWDGDGKPDLIIGAEDGSVVWHRNTGTPSKPDLGPARPLVGKSPVGWGGDDKRRPGEHGLRVKPCVFDWDGDGRPELLLGDLCGGFVGKPTRTESETAEEHSAAALLPGFRQKWAETFRAYQKASRERERPEADELRTKLTRLRDEIARLQDIQERYRPHSQAHGFVWLFRRAPKGG